MTITTAQEQRLNKSMKAAADISMGTLLKTLEAADPAAIDALIPAVAGTAEASKLALLGANKNLDVLAVADLKLGAGAGTSVTATAAELNLLHNVSAGLTTSEIDVLDGITKTTGEINALVGGVAGGYKLAHGVATIGTASDTVVTGLATVVSATVSLVSAPSMTHMFSTVTVGNQSGAPAAGSIIINSYKPTAVGDVTPIAADTVFSNVYWTALGT